ncbi:hypothetical protein [Nocardia sp. CA-119907]|uniref:hypothetical protein n=1 Tax=Nocardia sp. CA-119907 TaxID=3239973 RepID=UPI003D979D78
MGPNEEAAAALTPCHRAASSKRDVRSRRPGVSPEVCAHCTGGHVAGNLFTDSTANSSGELVRRITSHLDAMNWQQLSTTPTESS